MYKHVVVGPGSDCVDVAVIMWQERKFLEQQVENVDIAMKRLADQHRAAVAQLERESLQLKHQLLRGIYTSPYNEDHLNRFVKFLHHSRIPNYTVVHRKTSHERFVVSVSNLHQCS